MDWQNMKKYIDGKVLGVIRIKNGWGYRIELVYPDGSKIKTQKSGFKSKKEAIAQRDITVSEVKSGKFIVYPKVKVKDFFPYWYEQYLIKEKGTISNNTLLSYRNSVFNYVVPEFGEWYMSSIRGVDERRFIHKVAEKSESMAALCKTTLKVGFDYAVEKNIIANNPMDGVSIRVSQKKKKPYHQRSIDTSKVLNEKQMQILIENAKESPIYILILFGVLMGLRISEAIGVKYSDVNYLTRELTIKRQLGKKAGSTAKDCKPKMLNLQELPPKTDSGYRTITIPDIVFDEILRLRKQYEKNRSRRKREFRDLDYICCSTYGKPRSRGYYYRYYKPLLKEAGLPDTIRFHDLRASYATMLISRDCNPKAVSLKLGQASERVTLDVYTETQAIIMDEVDAIERMIARVYPKDIEDDISDIHIDTDRYI